MQNPIIRYESKTLSFNINDMISSTGILTPSDEFTYWNEAKHSRGNRDRAEHFVELFQPISSEFGSLELMTILDVSGSLELKCKN